jgi:hypothetical protein
MITYRWHHWSAATNRKRSHTARGAVARLLGGLFAALALVTGMGTWTPSAEAASFGWAYLWADQPTAPSYTPSLAYQFNSSGATNTVVRTGVGRYTAKLPNLGSQTGHVQVTAYGTGSERCKVERWYPSGTTQQVNVRCFTSTGTPVDTRFTMTYVSGISLVGSPCCPTSSGTAAAYVMANQPTSPSYTPILAYQFNDAGATNTITRSGLGIYKVQFPFMSLDRGHVQVTAHGGGPQYCKVVSWTPGAGVEVRCFGSSGLPEDTFFDVTFLRSYLVG